MGNFLGSASGKRGYDPTKGEKDVRDLGGLSDNDMAMLDELPSDAVRRRTLMGWFGSHGGRWAWNVWCAARGRPQRDPEVTAGK